MNGRNKKLLHCLRLLMHAAKTKKKFAWKYRSCWTRTKAASCDAHRMWVRKADRFEDLSERKNTIGRDYHRRCSSSSLIFFRSAMTFFMDRDYHQILMFSLFDSSSWWFTQVCFNSRLMVMLMIHFLAILKYFKRLSCKKLSWNFFD